ncbi:MAG: DNA polymerase, partial [Myxococcota bacterium]
DEATASAATTLIPLMSALTPLLRRTQLTRPYQLEVDLVPAVVAMERTGFGIDAVAFQRIADGWARERRDDPAPERVARLDKLLSTYAHWPRDFARRGRIHCRLHPLAAESGRFSCTDPNLQQVPGQHTAPGLRACFVPSPEHVLIVADYAQIELRVAAHLAPCDALRAVFHEGRDPHRATAATITGKPEAEITDRERKLAKAVNFGFLFGMGAKRFASYARDSYGVEVDDAEAKRARQAFFDTFPGVAAWHRRVSGVGRHGPVTVRTALGRRKKFAEGRFSFNAALNIPVQGTAAEGFKQAMVELHEQLPSIEGRGVLVVHDEYIAEVPAARADVGRALVQTVMETAMAKVVDSVPISVEARVAEHWS